MSEELKPCPFCNGVVDWCQCDESNCLRILCKVCGLEAYWNVEVKEEIQELWNDRPDTTTEYEWADINEYEKFQEDYVKESVEAIYFRHGFNTARELKP